MDSIPQILNEVHRCRRCATLEPWTKFDSAAHGNHNARAMIISEAPGGRSIQQGAMWMGAGGRRLRSVLRELGTTLEEEFYITDTVKCLPPGDRDPYPQEAGACKRFLDREIAAVKPELIVSFGRFALDYIARNHTPISQMPTGRITDLHTESGYPRIRFESFDVIALVHPTNANRYFRPYEIYREHLREIFLRVMDLGKAQAGHACLCGRKSGRCTRQDTV